MHQENANNFFGDMLKFLTIFFKYKWMIVAIFLTISVVGVVMVKRMPTLYEAKASILVKLGHESMYRPETQGGALACNESRKRL